MQVLDERYKRLANGSAEAAENGMRRRSLTHFGRHERSGGVFAVFITPCGSQIANREAMEAPAVGRSYRAIPFAHTIRSRRGEGPANEQRKADWLHSDTRTLRY